MLMQNSEKKSTTELKQIFGQVLTQEPEHTKKDTGRNTINLLADDILKLLKKGYQIKEISKILNESGAGYSINTLNIYISQLKRKAMKTSKRGKKNKESKMVRDKVESGGDSKQGTKDTDTVTVNQETKRPESTGDINISSDVI